MEAMTPLTRAQIEAIGTREPVSVSWAKESHVPLTVAERDALVKVALGLIALGPEIDTALHPKPQTTTLEESWFHMQLLLRQVRALTEGEG